MAEIARQRAGQAKRRRLSKLVCGLVAMSACISLVDQTADAQPATTDRRPNIILIVADDLGYSDIGAFGGEISTPNLDAIALRGTRALNYYVAPACSPTRAMLLTGRDNHVAGFGTMPEVASADQRGAPGYEGYIPKSLPMLAERLSAAGYVTMMSGKWHLGAGEGQGPSSRGFSKSFALLQGAHNHFGGAQSEEFQRRKIAPQYRLDGAPASWPSGGYSSQVFADRLIEFLGASDRSKPVFAYLAFTAPHWPLQARPKTIARYRGVYDGGPDAIVAARMQRMADAGLIPRAMRTRALGDAARWNALTPEQRRYEARKMEVYAAMVEEMDTQIGRVLAELRAQGRLDNSYIIFMSDNGPEGLVFDRIIDPARPTEPLAIPIDNSVANLGAANSYFSYGPAWGQASAAPYWGTKEHTSEGGLRAPLIVAGPGLPSGQIVRDTLHVLDMMPTMLSMAGTGAVPPGQGVHGIDALPALKTGPGRRAVARRTIYTELFYRAAVRSGNLKAIYQPSRLPIFGPPSKPGEVAWQLFDLATDPGETQDIAGKRRKDLERMKADWRRYAKAHGVVLLPEDR